MKKILIVLVLFVQISEAYVQFRSNEKLVGDSEYIVIAKIQDVINTAKTSDWRDVKATIIKNKLKVIESIKGSWILEKELILYTYKFDGWMEDNVELPSVDSKVLLFLKKNDQGELKPVNGIQGVWQIRNGKLSGVGAGITFEQIREMVQNQTNSCKSEVFTSIIDTAELQTEVGHYKEALKAYRKAYGICPMKDLEEQMAWLMGEVSDE